MISTPVTYNDTIKEKVDSFNSIAHSEKRGTYWNNKDDLELEIVKKHIKEHYIHNQNYTCPYCQQRIVVEHNAVWDIEHIIPKSSHPQFLFEPQNLCVSCKDCNGEKLNKNVLVRPNAVRFPRDSTGYIFVHPHFDKYNDHIRIVGDYSFFFADTEKGRKTIEICGLIRFTVALSNYAPLPTEVFTKSHTYHQKIMETDSSKEQLLYLCLLENEINKIKDQLLGEFSK